MKKTLIAGNWKMNGSLAANSALVAALDAGMHVRRPAKCDVALCVPSVYLAQMQQLCTKSGIELGSQDVSQPRVGCVYG